jgi:hypothetical protein
MEVGFIISTFKINQTAAIESVGEIAADQCRLSEFSFKRRSRRVESWEPAPIGRRGELERRLQVLIEL